MNSRGKISLAFALVLGTLLVVSAAATRMAVRAKNARLIREMNRMEGFYQSEIAAWALKNKGANGTGSTWTPYVVTDQRMIASLRREGNLKVAVLNGKYCGVASFNPSKTEYMTCLNPGGPISSPPTTCKGQPYGAPPPPLAGATWHSFSDDFSIDPNTNPDWVLNRHHFWSNYPGSEDLYTCKWVAPGEFRIVEPTGGGGTKETGFGCQMVVNAPGFRPGPQWNASYDFYVKGADDCADEMAFLWNTNTWLGREAVGWQGYDYYFPKYYGFRGDVYKNGSVGSGGGTGNTSTFPAEPSDSFFAVYHGIFANNSPAPYATANYPSICNATWRHVELSYQHDTDSSGNYLPTESGTFVAKVNGVEIIRQKIDCVDYQFPYFALYGRSGADTAHIYVKNLQINSLY
jgi:hypothetical protein